MYRKETKSIILLALMVSLSLSTAASSLFNVAAATIPNEVIVPGFTPYSEVPGILEELNASERVLVQVIGQSADGHDLYLAIVADPTVLDNLDFYKEFAELIVEDPELAWDLVEDGTVDYKATIFITGSIHGDEMMGTDACLDLIELLAYGDTEEVEAILSNTISLIYVCMNPDGRIANMRYNDNYFDLNRDWLTASQPEVRAGIEHVYKEWTPLVNIDLHGYWGEDIVLIEPCTPLHNPNAEEDLILKHLRPMAEDMEAYLKEIGIKTIIAERDWTAEWDDYTPIFTPQYGFYHGCFGTTFESTDPYDKNGSPEISINAHYTGTLGAYEYIVENKTEMFRDQTEIFLRGIRNEGHWLGGDQPNSFPYAYILPMDSELQMDPIETAKIVDFAIFHGVKVHRALEPFTANHVLYPAGTYVVLMNQPRAGLAMNMFWYGEDTSWALDYPPYDIYAWNFPELWGFNRIQANEPFEAKLVEVEEASYPVGGVEGEVGYGYALRDDTNNAVTMANRLLEEGITTYWATEPFEDAGKEFGVGTFIIPRQKQEEYIVETAESLHLTLFALSAEPAEKKPLTLPKIAILYDKGVDTSAYGETQFTLKNLEFDFDVLNYVNVRKSKLKGYDIVIVPDGSAWSIWKKLGNKGQRGLLEFIRNGGTYFGVGEGGGRLVNYAKFLNAYAYRTKWYGGYNNGIVRLDYDPTDPVAAYYPEGSYAYAFFPVWFEVWGNVDTVASYASDDMLLAGWWPFSEVAEGYGAVVRGMYGRGNVILSGVEPTFRAHTEFTFRLVANSIFLAASE